MGRLSLGDFHAKKEKVMVKLVKGKEFAIQLQTLLQEPVQEAGPVSRQQLALQIYRSFSDTLSELSSCTGPTGSHQIPDVEGGASASSGESKKKPGVKDRRGCYKRRRSADSWVTVTPTMEDGCAWRKYGQKAILNSDNPRSYFRCTHNKQDGCKAIKQVQRVKGDDQELYQTTYFNHHTCQETLRAPPLLMESDPVGPKLISFQTGILGSEQNHDDQSNNSSNLPYTTISSSVKMEDSLSEDVSTLDQDTWHDFTEELEPLVYKPVWVSFQDEWKLNDFHFFD